MDSSEQQQNISSSHQPVVDHAYTSVQTPPMSAPVPPPSTPIRVPLPPSASNFLNQNQFTPSQPFHYDIPPHFNRHRSHRLHDHHNSRAYTQSFQPQQHQMYAQPTFYPPSFPPLYHPYYTVPYPQYPPPLSHNHHQHHNNVQQHIHQPPPTQHYQNSYPPSPPIITAPLSSPIRPLVYNNTVVPSTIVPSPSSKTLPTVSHISILSGRSDFGAWNDGVRALIQHLGYTGHISNPSPLGINPRPDRIPTYPPVLPDNPTGDEFSLYKLWWECDNVVTHILLSRLHPSVRAILPSDDDDDTAVPRTSRTVYSILRKSYSVHGHTSGSALLAELRGLHCGSRIIEYVTKWRAGITQLRSARHPFSMRDIIEAFLDRLPTTVPYQILRFKYMDRIDAIAIDDISIFFKITDEVMDIDSMHKRLNPNASSSQRHTPTVPRSTHTLPNVPSSSSSTPQPTPSSLPSSMRPPRSSLICSNTNCRGTGHTVDKCFKPGGGLEGKRDEYLANLGRAQAHLAQLTDILESNLVFEETLPSDTVVPPEPDVLIEPTSTPPFSALSLAPVLPTTTSSTSVNEDFYFEAYSVFHPQLSFAFPAVDNSVELPTSVLPSAFAASALPFNSLLDSGCTHHIFRDRALFWEYDTTQAVPVKTANCGFLSTLARGTVRFRVTSGGRSVVFILKDCLHAPEAPINLISVGALNEKGAIFTFGPDRTTISFPATHPLLPNFSFDAVPFRRLSFLNCAFILPTPSPTPSVSASTPLLSLPDSALSALHPALPLTPDLWHRRFGHLGRAATRAVLTKDYATGIEYTGTFDHSHCIPCLIGKRPQQPFQYHGNRSTIPGELLHIDTCGPFPTLTPHKHSFFLEILEDHSHFGYLGLLHKKNDAFPFYCDTEAKIELVTESRIRTVRMDGAPELCEGQLGDHIRGRGIALQVTAPYAHQQNGKVERYIRTLEDDMQTLLADSGLPPSFWGWAVSTAQYLRNRLPTSVLPSGITPFEVHHRRKPDLSHLRVWGCQCFVLIPPELRTKGGPRRYEAIFVGYDENRIGWYVRDLKGAFHFSRDIIFNESTPGRLSGRLSSQSSSSSPSPHSSPPISPTTLPIARPIRTRALTPAGQAFADAIADRDARRLVRASTSSDGGAQEPSALSLATILDFASLNAYDSFPGHIPTWSLASEATVALQAFGLFSHSDPDRYLRAPRTYDLLKAPDSYHEARARPDAAVWREAMDREMKSLHDRNAFAPSDLPSHRHAIGVRWVYAYKFNPDGSIIRGKEKARLVAQGFSQRSEDFDETYAPVAKLTSIRIILAYAATHDLEVMASDVKTAFLHCRLRTELYCKQVPGYPLPDPKLVLRVLVALYGLRQSAFEFYTLLLRCFTSLGLHRCEVDHAVFLGTWATPPHPSIPSLPDNAPLFAIIPVHVDDSLFVCNSLPLYSWIISELQKSIEIIDMGPASLYLGNRITRDRTRRKIWLSQKSYCVELLRTWNMSNCTAASTPMSMKPYLLEPSPNALPEVKDDDIKPLFQKLVGSLIYLAICTRPDISYAAMALGQFNANPTRSHLLAAKRVLRYLAGTLDLALEFNFDGGVVPSTVGGFVRNCAISDADWASDESDRKSISGYCFYFLNSLVSWTAVKQKAISLSSTEAEYYSLTHAMKEALWIRLFLTLNSLPVPRPFPLLSDNQSACSLANNSAITSRSKHIDIRHHFIRDHIADGTFCTNWIPTSDMPADIFTKPLALPLFIKHRTSLGLVFL